MARPWRKTQAFADRNGRKNFFDRVPCGGKFMERPAWGFGTEPAARRAAASSFFLFQGLAMLGQIETFHFILFADPERNEEGNHFEQQKSD